MYNDLYKSVSCVTSYIVNKLIYSYDMNMYVQP
jgi:hypothetical protein